MITPFNPPPRVPLRPMTPPPSQPPQSGPRPGLPHQLPKADNSIFKGMGATRRSLKGYLRSKVVYKPYDPALRLMRKERTAEVDKFGKKYKTNISRDDVKDFLNNKYTGLKRQLYEKRYDTKEATRIRREISFWEKQLKTPNK